MTASNLTIDSSAWVEMLRGTPKGALVRERMGSARDCFTASISLAEVALVSVRRGRAPGHLRLDLALISEGSKIIPIDEPLATLAGQTTLELKASAARRGLRTPGLADGIVLATARATGSRLITTDRHFEGLAETIWLGKGEGPGTLGRAARIGAVGC